MAGVVLIPARASALAGAAPERADRGRRDVREPRRGEAGERPVGFPGDDHQQVAAEQRPVRVGVAGRADGQHRGGTHSVKRLAVAAS